MNNKRAFFALFVISFLTLFAEMVFIRYIPSNIYLISYYKNALLIAIFLGLGTGFMLSKTKRNYIELIPVATLVLICLIFYFNHYLKIDIDYTTKDESIWPEFWANPRSQSMPLPLFLLFAYIVMTFYFIPFGQETVRAMQPFKPIAAYSINIAGSLTGVILFALVGWLWTFPAVWFALLLIPLLWWIYRSSTKLMKVISSAAIILTIMLLVSFHSSHNTIELWSPYSKIKVYSFSEKTDMGFISTTNGNPQVGSLNFDIKNMPWIEESIATYEIPYTFLKPSSVLILGAGAGNEAVVALRNGVREVTAVEIDPVFAMLGREISPHRPFNDRRVEVYVDDARAFLHKTKKRYDLIVFGFLDSQYLLSHKSNIRTENFVYTIESFRRAKELLTENGILQLNYNAPKPEVRARFYLMLKDVFQEAPVALVPSKPITGNITFLAGPGLKKDIPEFHGFQKVYYKGEGIEYPTDDWPFLYIAKKGIPREYWSMIVAIPILSFLFVKGIARSNAGFSLKYFMLGFGFMLLQTKSITTYALFFGSTVTVISVTIAAILLAILIANLLVYKFDIQGTRSSYPLLFVTLAILYSLPLEAFLGLSWATKVIIAIVLISAPIFFAAIIFGTYFARSKQIDIDLGSNILGAVLGGVGEYASMSLGFSALYLISLLAYLIAYFADSTNRDR